MKFNLQHYNEFKGWVRWHDYISISFNEFHFLTIRRFDFLEERETIGEVLVSALHVTFLGFNVYSWFWEH